MIISHKHKFIFIHVPKTAGTSLELFYAKNHKHESDVITRINDFGSLVQNNTGFFNPLPELITHSYEYKKTIGQFINQQKFEPHHSAIVVKQRLGSKIWNSYYKFCIERNPWDKMVSRYFMSWGKSGTDRTGKTFEDWVRRGTKFPDGYPLYTWKNKVIVDRVIKFENLNTELKQVFDHVGMPFETLDEFAHANFRKDKSYRDYHNEYTKQKTSEYFKREIDLLEYNY